MYFCTFKRGKGRGIWAFQTERTHQKVFFSTYSLNDTFIRINIYIYICVFRESKSKATHCRKEKWNSDLKLQRLLLKKKKKLFVTYYIDSRYPSFFCFSSRAQKSKRIIQNVISYLFFSESGSTLMQFPLHIKDACNFFTQNFLPLPQQKKRKRRVYYTILSGSSLVFFLLLVWSSCDL